VAAYARHAAGPEWDELGKAAKRSRPATLSGLVKFIAAVLLLIVVYPFHQEFAGAACVVIAALVLFVADFVMSDTDNPLKGVWNVRPDAFTEVGR
jgi:VIT1/CCC1 family predicted Fe2+/Mn2+ transporter